MAGANVATVIIMLLIGYSDRVNPQSFHLFANAGLAYPVFLVFNLLFLIFWCFVKIRWVVIPLLGFVFGFLPTRNYCPINLTDDTAKSNLKVLSYNVWGFGFLVTATMIILFLHILPNRVPILCACKRLVKLHLPIRKYKTSFSSLSISRHIEERK